MNNANNATTSTAFNQSGSSYLHVDGLTSLRTEATFSSTIRDMNDVEEPRSNMQPIYEEPLYDDTGVTVTELCATCSHNGIKKEATHFCPGCDRRGRYICGDKCLKDHSMWCKGPQHEVQSLSIDRHSDPVDTYTTIRSPEGSRVSGRPRGTSTSEEEHYINCMPEPQQLETQRSVSSWLLHETNADGSESSDYTMLRTEDSRTENSSHGYAVASSIGQSDEGERPLPRPVRGRNAQENWVMYSDEYHSEDSYPTSHVYSYPDGRSPIRRGIALPTQRVVSDPSGWGNISTSTTRRLDMVYNAQAPQKAHKKNNKCVIQ